MHKGRRIYSFLAVLLSVCCTCIALPLSAQKKRISDPVQDFLSSEETDTAHVLIHKIVYDFNGDGLQDIALSSSITWGNAGGSWLFYFRKKDKSYYLYDNFALLHPWAYAIVRQNGKPNVLVVYQRANCCSGDIVYFSIEKRGFKLIRSRSVGFKKKMGGNEVGVIVDKALSKGHSGREYTAPLGCQLSGKQGCWMRR